MNPVPRYNVLGVGVSALNLDQARDLVLGTRGRPRCGYVCLGTVHNVSEARRDPAYRRILNDSWLTTPDGMPLVWLAHRQGRHAVTRVYGPDLMLAVCAAGRTLAATRAPRLGGAAGAGGHVLAAAATRFSRALARLGELPAPVLHFSATPRTR